MESVQKWFIDVIQNHYYDFDGRVNREPFWMYVLWNFIASIAVSILVSIIHLGFISTLISLALILPSLGIGARRLHDTGRSGWFQLIGIIPIIGWIILIYFAVQEGEAGANMYGPNPLAGSAPQNPPTPAAPMQ